MVEQVKFSAEGILEVMWAVGGILEVAGGGVGVPGVRLWSFKWIFVHFGLLTFERLMCPSFLY